MAPAPADDGPESIDRLLREASRGEPRAVDELLGRYRDRLRRMIENRLDPRLMARVDASDIVQETLLDASKKLPAYASDRPLPFYPWLHRLATERLAQAYRHHRSTEARSVDREETMTSPWSDRSTCLLADRLVSRDATPRESLLREERQQQVRDALETMTSTDREILFMRYVEDLTFPEIAAILDLGESAVKMRHLRALQRIRALIDDRDGEAAQ